jgi:poly(A) polymerase
MTQPYLQAKTIVSRLVQAGYTAYFAGGWVRDYVMGHPSQDIDIATDAPPTVIMSLFSQTLLVGLQFGIVIVVIEGQQFEVATFRKDLAYKDGRHPIGIELSTPEEDALRRDFTINGMFYDPLNKIIHDYVGGQDDIKRGIIRTIGNPQERFFEDRLRMLRAFRFSARFDFAIESATQDAIRNNASLFFPAVAIERVWLEFSKMAKYPRFNQALVEMYRLGLLQMIFPEISQISLIEIQQQTDSYAHFPSDTPTIFYLMELFRDCSIKQKMEIAQRLKISKREIEAVEFFDSVEKSIQQEKQLNTINLCQWVLLFAHPKCKMVLHILAARKPLPEREPFLDFYRKRLHQLYPHVERKKMRESIVSAAILQEYGVKPGPRMGVLLKEAERIAIEEDLGEVPPVLSRLQQLPIWKDHA